MSNQESTAMAAASNRKNDDNRQDKAIDNNENPEETIGLGELWDTLYNELINMGRALTCPLCLSTYTDAVVLPCVHAYCKGCLQAAFHCGQPRCPTCLSKASKRSIAPAPILNQLVHAYKLSLRQFGLAPVQYDPQYNAMTQLAPGEAAAESGGMTIEPLDTSSRRNAQASRSALLDCHTHLQVSRTWQKVLQERQDSHSANDDDDDPDEHNNPKGRNASKSTTATNLPSNIPTKSRLHQWQQQQQAQVIASHERALLDAAKEHKNPKPSPVINLSQQQEISMEHALEQTAADQRWTQESDNPKNGNDSHTNNNNRDASSQFYLTPREQATDSNPQQQPFNNNGNAGLEENSTNNSVKENNEEPICTAESFETSREMSESYPHGNQRGSYPSLSIAESFETSATEPMVQEEEGNDDKGDAVMQDAEEEDGKKKGGEIGTTRTTIHNGITPLQSNAVSRTAGEDNDEGEDESNHSATEDIDQAPTNDNDTDTSLNNTGDNYYDSSLQINSVFRHSAVENNDQGSGPSDNNDVEMQDSNSSSEAIDDGNKGPEFKLGDVVTVQPRTWPGVNKPGGVARITKVIPESSSYHVEYILGGREKCVDAVFISFPPEEMIVKEEPKNDDGEGNKGTGRARKSRRISTKHQVDTTVPKPEDVLPPELLKSLAKEGFDVTPTAANTSTANKENAAPKVSIKSEPGASSAARIPTRSRSHSGTRRQARAKAPSRRAKSAGKLTATHARSTSRGSKGRTTQPLQESKLAVRQETQKNAASSSNEPGDGTQSKKKAVKATTASKTKAKTATANNNKSKSTTTSKTTNGPSKRQKTAADSSPGKWPPLPTSTAEICQLADTHYRERIQGALDASVLTLVCSSLSDTDKADLKALAKEAKKNGVHIKQTENFHANKVTACVIPGANATEDPNNLVGQCRTLKAMRSALAGIPLVSTAWIGACRAQKKVIMPSESMFIRTLPVKKSTNSSSKAYADYGVAKIAAQASHRANHTLRSCTVQLCGSFSRPPKADVQLLLRESGANVSLQTSSTLATLRNQATDGLVVLLCDDALSTVPDALRRQVKTVLENNSATNGVLLVNPQWLFDSVVSGSPMEAGEYAPSGGQPLELWKLQQAKK